MHYSHFFEIISVLSVTLFSIFTAANSKKQKTEHTVAPLMLSTSAALLLHTVCLIIIRIENEKPSIISDKIIIAYILFIISFMCYALSSFMMFRMIRSFSENKEKRHTAAKIVSTLPLAVFMLITALLTFNGFSFKLDSLNFTGYIMFAIATFVVCVLYNLLTLIFLAVKHKHFTANQHISVIFLCVAVFFSMMSLKDILYPYPFVSLAPSAAFAVMFIYFTFRNSRIIQPVEAISDNLPTKNESTNDSTIKETFLAHISHEIRTPVNSMLGMSEMILRKSFDEEIRNYAITAEKSGRGLLELTNNLIDYTNLSSGNITSPSAVYKTRELFEKLILETERKLEGKQVQLVTDISSNIPSEFLGDESNVYRIISNLISNAVKFTKSGTISITAFSEQTEDGTAELSVCVKDTGCGISEKMLPLIFDCFARSEESKNTYVEGMGLGLPVTAKLLRLLNGNVDVQSEYGKGSSFTVKIPQKISSISPMGVVSSYSANENRNNDFFTIKESDVLIADDNEVNLFVLHEFLKQFGIDADIANSGEECFELASKKYYDIIFLDHMMPDPDGVKTMHMIKETAGCASSGSEIIVTTANAVTGVREQYISEGFSDYLSKPVEFDKLAAILKAHIPAEKTAHRSSTAPPVDTQIIFSMENISHINTAAGLDLYSDNRPDYFKALAGYANNAGNCAEALENAFLHRNMAAYAAAAAEVRTASYNIGADNLADMAKFQEMFANSGKYDDIMTLHLDFMNAFVAVTAEAARICTENAPELISPELTE